MKNYCLILLCFILFTGFTGLTAQEAPLVYSLEGKAKYTPADGNKTKLAVGQELSGAGTLKLKKRSRVGVYLNDAFVYMEGPATVDLAGLAESEGLRESDVNTLFGKQLEASLHPYYASEGFGFAPSSGGGTGSSAPGVPPKQEKSGAGNKDRAISIQSPLIGKVSGEVITFRWVLRKQDVTVQDFTFKIIDRAGETVHEQKVNGYSLTLNLPQMGLETGKDYRWSVAATGTESVDSGPLSLSYTAAQDQQQIITEMTADPAYQQASPAARLLQASAYFEYFDYLQAAKEALNEARRTNPKNVLVQRMYKSFLYRYDLVE
jgi:hypothetical protein